MKLDKAGVNEGMEQTGKNQRLLQMGIYVIRS
jgi:hypothetical protein